MKIGEFIDVREFPAVVVADDVRELRAKPLDDVTRDFVSGYLGYDERSRHALATAVGSLAQAEHGGGYFVNGAFGSGKSHLLGLLALLCDGAAHDAFAQTQPQLAACLENFAPRLVVHFSLDEYDAARFTLEELFWRELRLQWARQGLPADDLVLPEGGARGETFAALDEALVRHGLRGLVACIDELSLFLSARPEADRHRALQGDASFLQYLGQRARRAPLWVFAALQKNIEDIGEIEAYSLSQIRDRFTMLPLSLAHLPSLIERRLVARREPDALRHFCHESFEALQRALPRLDFGPSEWEALYPFHPATVQLLEQVVSRFLSRTRSAALFCCGAIDLQADAGARVLPGALFDYIRPELDNHPELRALATVRDCWESEIDDLTPDARDREALILLMQGLLLFHIAGRKPTVLELANALALDAKLSGDGNYQYATVLLEKLRVRGSYLVVERREGEFADRYALDLATRVGELVRRHTAATLLGLPTGDARIARYATACCRDEGLPLASIETAGGYLVQWRNAPRRLAVGLWHPDLDFEQLANRVAALGQPGVQDDALLLLAPPFAPHRELSPLIGSLAKQIGDARRRAALLAWVPREPTHDEWDLAREATAQHLLEADPALLDNRRGRAVLDRIRGEAGAREANLGRVAARLLREGQLTSAAGASIEAADLFGAQTWSGALEAICDFALPAVYPHFESVAPRLRVLSGSNADALCLEVLRRPASAPFFAASLERPARAIAEPLGIARQTQGRWRIEGLRDELAGHIKELVTPAGVSLGALESVAAKSEWGLAPEQTAVAVCALLRGGDLIAYDGRDTALAPASIGMPLRRGVHYLRFGQLLDPALWARLGKLFALLELAPLPTQDFAAQERAREALAAWLETACAETELAQARLHQLRRRLNHTPGQWPATQAAWATMETLLHALGQSGTAEQTLRAAASLDLDALAAAVTHWRAVAAGLDRDHERLLGAHAAITNPDLAIPPELQSRRNQLLERFDAGEAVLRDADLLPHCDAWRADYAVAYQQWHAAQHAPERFNSWRRLATGAAARAVERLATIETRRLADSSALRQAIETELDKGCSRDGALHGDAVTCAACRLHWGERLQLRDIGEFEEVAGSALLALHQAMREPAVQSFLERQPIGTGLLAWDGDATNLLPLLDDRALQMLNEAFRPRRVVQRTYKVLTEYFDACRTRRDYETAFAKWLDGGEQLGEEDEVVVV